VNLSVSWVSCGGEIILSPTDLLKTDSSDIILLLSRQFPRTDSISSDLITTNCSMPLLLLGHARTMHLNVPCVLGYVWLGCGCEKKVVVRC
jgi:hypothetical protein